MAITYERLKGFIPRRFEDKPFDLYLPFFRDEDMLISILDDYEVNHVYASCTDEGRVAFFNAVTSQVGRLTHETERLFSAIAQGGGEKRKEVALRYMTPDGNEGVWMGAAWEALRNSTVDGQIKPFDKTKYLWWEKVLFKSNAEFIYADFDDIIPSDPKNALFYIDRPDDLGYLDKVRLSEYKAKVQRMGAEIIHCY